MNDPQTAYIEPAAALSDDIVDLSVSNDCYRWHANDAILCVPRTAIVDLHIAPGTFGLVSFYSFGFEFVKPKGVWAMLLFTDENDAWLREFASELANVIPDEVVNLIA